MIWDAHLHTSFSGDCDTPVTDVIDRAEMLGLPGITITDHLDLIYPEDPSLFLLDFEKYHDTITKIKNVPTGFPVLFGIEYGLAAGTGIGQKMDEITDRYQFDFIIGSSHIAHGKDPYYPEYFEGRSASDGFREYFESILENIRDWDGFDVYGHLDYVVRYGPQDAQTYDWKDYLDLFDEILKELIRRGKGIEVNTAGLAYGLSFPHPHPGIIVRYRELGGEIITIGSDAHHKENVGYGFDKIPEILKAAGFDHYCIFKNRKPTFITLP